MENIAMTDTRHLFRHLTVRKPNKWDEPRAHSLNKSQLDALMNLPRIYVEEGKTTPFSSIFVNESGPEHLLVIVDYKEATPLKVFYVNTEGYDYARYVLRLTKKEFARLDV